MARNKVRLTAEQRALIVRGIQPGLQKLAGKLSDSEANFLETLQHFGRVSREDAEDAFGYFLKHKLVTRDLVNRTYNVKHGAYLEPESIQHAAKLYKESKVRRSR